MLDIKYIRENAEQIKEAAKNKNITIDIDKLLKTDDERRALQTKIDELRAERNELAKTNKKGKPTEEQVNKGRDIKENIAQKEEELEKVNMKILSILNGENRQNLILNLKIIFKLLKIWIFLILKEARR